MHRSAIRALVVLAGLAISLGFGYLAIRGVRPQAAWQALRENNDWWLLPSLATLAVAMLARVVRWQLLFRGRPAAVGEPDQSSRGGPALQQRPPGPRRWRPGSWRLSATRKPRSPSRPRPWSSSGSSTFRHCSSCCSCSCPGCRRSGGSRLPPASRAPACWASPCSDSSSAAYGRGRAGRAPA